MGLKINYIFSFISSFQSIFMWECILKEMRRCQTKKGEKKKTVCAGKQVMKERSVHGHSCGGTRSTTAIWDLRQANLQEHCGGGYRLRLPDVHFTVTEDDATR